VTLIIDAAPLVALGDSRDPQHARVSDVLRAEPVKLVEPAPVSAEADYLIRTPHRGAVHGAVTMASCMRERSRSRVR
jgi:hypothetical protein